MKRSVLLVNIIGIFALGYLLYAGRMNMFVNPVTTYAGTNAAILSTSTVVGFFAVISLVLVVISDIYWLLTGKKS